MTDIHEQAPNAAENSAPNGTATPSRARRGSLNSMLLPELQQLAGGMGISTSKVKKSDLIAAIQAARAGTPSAPNDAATEQVARNGARREPRAARTAPARDAAPISHAAPDPRPVESQATQGAIAPPAERNDLGQRDDRGQRNDGGQRDDRGQRQQNSQNQGGGQHNNGQRSQSGPNNQGSNQSGGHNNNQNNQNNQFSQSGGQNQSNQISSGAGQNDDEYEGGRRRGRRYRDRRGRTRDRQGGGVQASGGGNQDVEPSVSDDDVLVPVAGILDAIEDKNTWFIRTGGYYASSDDVYVANSYVRRFNLRRGDAVTGAIKQVDGERREKYNPLVRLDTVNGAVPVPNASRVEFTKLTPLYPQERFRLETEPHILTTRVIDLVMPIGKGQRALIVSPPKAGKTMVLQAIANAIAVNNPEVHLMVVLVDERPEEVTDMQRTVKGEVIASTFDRKPVDHTTVAELSIERAKRLVEMGHDVVVLLDSITRLGRAYNLAAPASGRILSGGVDSTALYPPKRFLGAARNIENGGSLTIICTALVETGSAGDTVIFEEFKGTGNAELKLDRKIADKRIFPAIDVDQSSTRKEEILLSPDELAVTIKLRRVLHALESQQALDLLLDRLRKTRTNLEFLMQIAKTTPGQD
ncbi:MAG: transcription termination factor Rho [Actinomycetota bacterium]|nr:transcription termination factor Rho [Actinomycetota bacterium]